MDTPTQVWPDRSGSDVTGEVCDALLEAATQQQRANPTSIFAYALKSAVTTISVRFEDEQGIEADEYNRINALVKDPLRKLNESGAFDHESPRGRTALSELIGRLNAL